MIYLDIYKRLALDHSARSAHPRQVGRQARQVNSLKQNSVDAPMKEQQANAASTIEMAQGLDRLILQQSVLIQNLEHEARRNHSTTAALIALAQALIESHPSPTLLSHCFMDQIDAMGSILSPSQVDMYREDVQKLNLFILEVVNRKA